MCGRDTREVRDRLIWAHLLVLILFAILAIWNIIFTNEFYDKSQKDVYIGVSSSSTNEETGEVTDDGEYWTMPKRYFVLFNFVWGCFLASIYLYFWYITSSFSKEMRHKRDE